MGNYWRTIIHFWKMTIKTHLAYRVNFFTDALVQPIISAVIEFILWKAVFSYHSGSTIAGFTAEAYYAYLVFATFCSRISANWMYEFRMIEDVESGNINAIIVRPQSFYEYYLWQFLSYKILIFIFSIPLPIAVSYWAQLPVDWARLPLFLINFFCHLVFTYSLSFLVSLLAFRMVKVTAVTVTKNLGLWLFSGELIPLDLFPEKVASWLKALPFANAVYNPVGYLTKRIETPEMILRTISLFLFTGGLILVCRWAWNKSLRHYSGTAA